MYQQPDLRLSEQTNFKIFQHAFNSVTFATAFLKANRSPTLVEASNAAVQNNLCNFSLVVYRKEEF